MGICMRWQIAQFIFCDQQQTLTLKDSSIQLEPMMVELLSYFCLHSNQIISKDLLIEQVWLGRIVSDNAVSKLITKLRKVFADDVRQPKFIATFPKKGYKFIASVMPITEEALPPTLNVDETLKKVKQIANRSLNVNRVRLLTSTLLILFIVVIALNSLRQQTQKALPVSSYAKVLTTDAGDELFPSFSPDGTRVAYMSYKSDRMQLMIKNVIDEHIIEISHGENIGVGPADWSGDGKFIVYLVASAQQCQYYIRRLRGLTFGEPQLIHNCPPGSYGKIAFTHDSTRLIYSESEGDNTPYSLFELNLTTNKKKRLNQPEIFLGGNSQFDLHPTMNKLLISSPDKQQWEGFYSLDLETEQLTLLFKQDAYICCGIWDHTGDRVVLMGEHPAYQLLSYDLAGKDRQVIYSGSIQVRNPRRHVNGIDYLFSSGKNNYDVHSLELYTKRQTVIANDSVDERLAAFAHHNNQVAYIGLASGNEEIWLTDTEINQRKRLTQFNDGRHYVDLMWSPDGKSLLALTLNEIHLIDSSTGQFRRLKIPQTQISGVSFKSDKSIAYSIKKNNQWRVYFYQLETNIVLPEAPKWQFIQYHSNAENTLWLDQNNKLFVGSSQKPVVEHKISPSTLINGRQFNLKKRGHLWSWFERDERAKIQSYSEQSNVISTLVHTDIEHFDITKNKLLFGHVQQINSNIYQTQSLDSQ